MNTSQDTFTKQVPIAIAALGQHMHEHQLPNPIDIEINAAQQRIRVRVPDEQAQTQWINTLILDGEENEPWMGPVWIKTTWQVRLPDLGIRFEIRGLRRKPDALHGERLLAVVPA